MSTKVKLLKAVAEQSSSNIDKVTVVGTGEVGIACVVTLLAQEITSNVVLMDMNEKKMEGELLDLQHGSLYLNAHVAAGKGGNFSCTADSKICIITAGVRQKDKETRLDLVGRNVEILKSIVPQLVKYSPDTILIIVSNPCDILAWACWKLSGLPKNRVIGSGTSLDSARFRFHIAEQLSVNPESVHGWIIGEHGDTSVAVWSGLNVAGVRIRDINPAAGLENDPEKWKAIHTRVIKSGFEVRNLKGCTNWGIGFSVTDICKAILRNSNKIIPVSTDIKGMCGVDFEVFVSLPCVIGRNGVSQIVDPNLTEAERCYLKNSAAKMAEIANGVKL